MSTRQYVNFISFCYKSLIFIYLSLITFGCAHNHNGTIQVSQPKVWRENAIMMSTGRQIAELRNFEEKVNLSATQGERIREYISKLKAQVGVKLSPGDSEARKTESPGQSKTDKTESVQKPDADSKSKLVIADEPIDALQRINDFYYNFEGAILEHLRDTSSQKNGYALYLLGFDISVTPGLATRTGYDGYLEFKIKAPPNSDIRVYSVSPQRYAERFSEELLTKRTLEAALEATEKVAKIDIGLARELKDQLFKIERYPIVSGFIDGPYTFGWIFHPRPTIAKGGKKIEYSLEPGIRHCYALVLVKDGSINAPKWFYIIDDKLIKDKIKYEDKANARKWFEELRKEYENILNNNNIVTHEAKKESEYIKVHLLDKAFKKLEDLDKFRNKIKEIENLEEELKKLKKECKESSDDYKKKSEKLEELEEDSLKPLKDLHRATLGFIGRQGKESKDNIKPIQEFKIKVSGGWIRHDCRWYNNDCGEIKSFESLLGGQSAQQRFTVALPDKVDRALEKIWAVMPNEAPGNEEPWVSIKGQGFTNDPLVFVGSQKALEVLVVSRDLILAKFPKSKLKGCHMVKVYAGGEAMVSSPNAFCYKSPLLEEPIPKFRVTRIHPQEGGANSKLKIEANMGVMDKVEKVVIGEMDVSLKEECLKDDNQAIEIVLPELPKDKPAGSVEIRLIFKDGTDMVPGNRYIVPFGFKYLR